jgi:subtilisin family serine protease
MPQYVLVNRRAGKFTPEAKHASRAAVATTLMRLEGSVRVVHDKDPADDLARRVVLLDADAAQVAKIRSTMPADAILEPAVRRSLHHHTPVEVKTSLPLSAALTARTARATASSYRVTIKGGGKPLSGIDVMFYLQDRAGQTHTTDTTTNSLGQARINVPAGHQVLFVEPIPYAGFWIMIAEAPPSGSTIDCAPIAKAGSGGTGWWHTVTGVSTSGGKRGAGIKVGVIDTGCGPHPNLAHVNLVGVFVDGQTLSGSQAGDVAQHGSHTSGIIGARSTKSGEFAGMASACDLFHARVFKGEGENDGPTQADLINAIDSLSRDNGCDLINMSLGGGPRSDAEEDAIRDAAQRGTVCICSAGNEAGPIDFPGAYPECISVSAIGMVGKAPVGTFSAGNRPKDPSQMGKNNLFLAVFSCFGDTLGCCAPGVGIVSTVPAKPGFPRPYMAMDGTSMASPAACGVLAAILSQDTHYKSLPRDISRANAARDLLNQHCKSIGLAVKFEGRGLPHV